jgi:hypothetical protein
MATIGRTFFTAYVTFLFRNASGELEEKTIQQDVTDEVNEGADEEELADRIYWKNIHGQYAEITITRGGVRTES